MSFNENRRALLRQPCTRDCPDRSPGCAVTCSRWAEYIKAREKEYERRKEIKQVSDAICDGYARLAKMARNR